MWHTTACSPTGGCPSSGRCAVVFAEFMAQGLGHAACMSLRELPGCFLNWRCCGTTLSVLAQQLVRCLHMPTLLELLVWLAGLRVRAARCSGRAELLPRCLTPSHALAHTLIHTCRVVSGKQSGELVVREAASVDVAASHVRLHLLHPASPSPPAPSSSTPSSSQHPHPQHQPINSSLTSRSHAVAPSVRLKDPRVAASRPVGSDGKLPGTQHRQFTPMVCSCILELRPHVGAGPHASSGHGTAHGLLGQFGLPNGGGGSSCIGPDAVPPGCALFAQLSWQPDGGSDMRGGPADSVLQKALQYMSAHAKGGTGSDAESEGSGSSPWEVQHPGGPGSILLCELEERCRK